MTPTELYFRDISDLHHPERDEEIALARKSREGDQEAREALISRNLMLVVKIAHCFKNQGVPLIDLIGEGNIGLVEGIDRFDPDHEKHARLSHYVAWHVKRRIREAVKERGERSTIRVPATLVTKSARLQQLIHVFLGERGRTPTTAELCQIGNLTEKDVEACQNVSQLCALPIEAAGQCCDERMSASPYAVSAKLDAIRELREAISQLKPRQREILSARWGLDGQQPTRLIEVADRFGISAQRAQQIEMNIMEKLRDKLKSHN